MMPRPGWSVPTRKFGGEKSRGLQVALWRVNNYRKRGVGSHVAGNSTLWLDTQPTLKHNVIAAICAYCLVQDKSTVRAPACGAFSAGANAKWIWGSLPNVAWLPSWFTLHVRVLLRPCNM
ncbi:hypothetical protein DPSP01_001864 [Paraphaeosphaeria sporulosa]